MSDKHSGYTVAPFPRMRQLVLDAGRNARRRHMIHGLVEFDVTAARQFIHDHKTHTGETLSFTAFVVACIGQAINQDRGVQALRNWRNQLVIFDDVDVLTMLEINADGHKMPMPHIFRAVNQRTFREIHDEIRSIQTRPERAEGMRFLRWFPLLPTFVRGWLYRIVERTPQWAKQYSGTMGMTSVGMFGSGGGWGIGMPVHSVSVTLGGIAEKPGVVEGRIEVREYLSVTISFDHDIVDGAPAARFVQRLKELVESGYGLWD